MASPRDDQSGGTVDSGRRGGQSLPVLGHPVRPFTPPPAVRKPPVVSFVSLGCAKNLVDSEAMLGRLAESGALISGDESLADTIVVNTCGFLESAREEALSVLAELAQRKRAGSLKRIVVAGCLVQRDGQSIRDRVPEVDALVGVNHRDDVVRAVWRMDRDSALDCYLGPYHPLVREGWNDRGRLRLTPRHYAYVRISEGCNQKCTFCTIPSIRGPMHSKTPQELVAECRELIADGAQELVLIGQDTTSYGEDIGCEPGLAPHGARGLAPDGARGLAGLLRELDRECAGARWIRLMYVYPSVMTDAIIEALAECPRIVKYVDMPLQHINDRVLKAMHRRVTRRQTEELLDKLRRRIPDLTIRTTFIVGFPGETEQEFAELLEFVRSFEFDAVGAFKYSPEPETPAARMGGQLDPAVKEERYERLMLTQQRVALAAARRRVGRTFEVLIDGEDERGNVARHAGQAPEVDGVCILPGGALKPGTFVTVRCTGAEGYDLVVQRVAQRERSRTPTAEKRVRAEPRP